MFRLMIILMLSLTCVLTCLAAPSLRTLYKAGKRHYRNGSLDKAQAAFDKAIEQNGKIARLYYARGLLFIKKKDYTRASTDFDEVIKLKPSSARAYAYRALCYLKIGDKSRARADCDIALALDEDDKIALKVQDDLEKQLIKTPKALVPNPGGNFVNTLGMKFIWIEPGQFKMGSSLDEVGNVAAGTLTAERMKSIVRKEQPRRSVFVGKGYWLAANEIKQKDFQKLMGDNPSHFRGAKLPIDSVKWSAAMEFCKRLTAKEKSAGTLPTNYHYTLPTEAQWEYACRAGTSSPFSFGTVILPSRVNCTFLEERRGKTIPVGSLPPNAWGLYEMHGNVSEWCLDQWNPHYRQAPTNEAVWGKIEARWSHVTRGGSYAESPVFCRSASRRAGRASFRNPVSRAARSLGQSTTSFFARQGFRVALTPLLAKKSK